MDSDQNKLNKLFSEGDTGLPPDLSWEQMEEGILEKMETLEATPSPGLSNGDIIKIVSTLLLCLLPVLFFNNGLLLESTGEASSESGLPIADAAEPAASSSALSATALKTEGEVPDHSILGAAVQTSGAANRSVYKEDKAAALPPANDGKDQRTTGSEAPFNPAPAPLSNSNLSILRKNAVSTERPLPDGDQASGIETETPAIQPPITELPNLATLNLAPQRAAAEPFLPGKVTIEPRTNLIPARQLSLHSGIAQWNPGYGQNLPENANYEQSILSYYTHLSYTHRFGNNYTLTAGLQYLQLETELQWSQRIEDYTTVTLQDTIVEIQVSALTGNSTEVRGDVEVSVDATRNVRHYNQYRILQIPIALGKSWMLGKRWQAGLSIGSAVNVLSQNKGRYIYQGVLREMDGPATELIDNRWSVHGLAMGRVGYQITPRLGVMMEAQYQKSLTDWANLPGFDMRPEVFNLGVGVFHTL